MTAEMLAKHMAPFPPLSSRPSAARAGIQVSVPCLFSDAGVLGSRVFRQSDSHRIETTAKKFFVARQPINQPHNRRAQAIKRRTREPPDGSTPRPPAGHAPPQPRIR